jgi:tetratricopeptide (TPR) repeat protein
MKIQSLRKIIDLSAILCALALSFSPHAFAQSGAICPEKQYNNLVSKPVPPADSATPSAFAKVDPAEQAEYKVFFNLHADNIDKLIQVGDAFVKKYPNGPFSEAVYSQLSIAEYQNQDFEKMDEYADKALALNPDDATVLVFTGWIIPHSANSTSAQLNKAEAYEKRALELLPTLTKPGAMTDKEFAVAKSEYESQAHSGMGLVYYQRQDFVKAVAEMKKATSGASHSDPSDYFVMGNSLDQLHYYSDAATAFKMCAAIPGGQQAICKQKAEIAKKEVVLKNDPPKAVNSSELSAPRNPARNSGPSN